MSNISDKILDKKLHNGIRLARFEGHLINELQAKLRILTKELVNLVKEIDPTSPSKEIYQRLRLEKLLTQSNQLIKDSYDEIENDLTGNLKDLAKVSLDKSVKEINDALGADIITSVGLKTDITFKFINDILIQGAPLSQFIENQSKNVIDKFSNVVRKGVQDQASLSDMVQMVRGSKEQNYTDGILNTSYKQAAMLVRTGVQSVNNQTALYLYEQNTDVIGSIQWISTLDNRTTPICQALDGLQWTLPDYEPIGHDQVFPGPTAHYGCRSGQLSVLRKDSEISKQLKAQLPESTRSSMDGQVSEKLNFEGWLKTKDEAFQKDLLGPARYKLWKNDNISLKDMVNQDNRPLTLAELAKLT